MAENKESISYINLSGFCQIHYANSESTKPTLVEPAEMAEIRVLTS